MCNNKYSIATIEGDFLVWRIPIFKIVSIPYKKIQDIPLFGLMMIKYLQNGKIKEEMCQICRIDQTTEILGALTNLSETIHFRFPGEK